MSLRRVIVAWTPPAIRPIAKRLGAVLRVMIHPGGYGSKSYFPESEKKSKRQIYRELVRTAWKWGRINPVEGTYFAFGLDRCDRKLTDYVFLEEFGKVKDALNSYSYDYNAILNNKIFTNIILRSWDLPVPELIGRIEKLDGILYLAKNGLSELLQEYLAKNDIRGFCKPLAGTGGHGAFQLVSRGGRLFADTAEISWEDLEKRIIPPMTFEELVCQHDMLSALHPSSINTIRIMTVRSAVNEIMVLGAFQRIGCGGRSVDNAHSGGVFVPISPEGRLMDIGHFKPGFGTTAREHPDTHIVFAGYRLPFFSESITLAKRVHSHISDVHSVGWDIAVTLQGPLIIEANADWDVLMLQQVCGGKRSEFETHFVRRYRELRLDRR
jgi:hypothetical protein